MRCVCVCVWVRVYVCKTVYVNGGVHRPNKMYTHASASSQHIDLKQRHIAHVEYYIIVIERLDAPIIVWI